ncbi:MAG: ADP-forming succinate--CoA ligase subunit beta [Rickettsiales bacterium]|nr:ADP-forming succinate--CoA ligase subunit beta [Rickettsiales bacterium]OUV54567.1 MAG: succinate--CoA ligase subunit beta [Rickettsiales bacterium TMED127]|tara:strand:+ start:8010 stop:9173 length:1164 start_codon:yes stop_codon:yes gene_type:complete
MDIHEYQAKQLISKFGVNIPAGEVIFQPHEAITVISWLNEDQVVVKAQVHAGGRGKGGGIKVCKGHDEIIENVEKILGMKLVTSQTGPEGKVVRRVYLEKAFDIKKEFYFCVTVDRETGGNTIITSKKGGVNIEDVAEKNPEEIFKVKLGPGSPLLTHHARTIAYQLGLSGVAAKKAQKNFVSLYNAFTKLDASLLEINPLAVTNNDDVVALDCKASFDDNALYRQREIAGMKDDNEYDPLELEAARHDLNYVKLDGNIGLMVNGAGLSMATMDIIQHYGGKAANFMDVAGAATPERVAAAFKLIYRDSDVMGILINIFGGMMRCNDIAQGLVNAAKDVGLDKPLVVRLEGTNVEMGMDILKSSGFPITPVPTMDQAAKEIVELVNK